MFLEQHVPPANAETYRWRGDMGLLDRLSYPKLDAIPRNWNMTLLDVTAIGERPPLLLPEPDSNQPERLLLKNKPSETRHQEDSKKRNIRPISPSHEPSTELTQLPPKKKRYAVILNSAQLHRT